MIELKPGKMTEVRFESHITVKDLYDHLATAIAEGHADLLVQTGMDSEWGMPIGFQAHAPRLVSNPMTRSTNTWQENLAHYVLESATVGRFLIAGSSDKKILSDGAEGTFNTDEFVPIDPKEWDEVEAVMRSELEQAGLSHLIEETEARCPRRLIVSRQAESA